MKTVAVVQARMTSERLPGKALIEVNGKPILQHVVDRVRQAKLVDHVVVATSTDLTDDPIVEWCNVYGVSCYRGSLTDVLDRYYQCATLYNADNIARITADCPLLNPPLLDQTIFALTHNRADYADTQGWPNGIGQESFTTTALERTWREATDRYDREHVVPYMTEPANGFSRVTILSADEDDWPPVTLDTPEDLQRLTPLLT